ncbi:glycosyltransferase family 2 protein [Photobacterium damselae]
MIDIVIATYNGSKYIEEQLLSILNNVNFKILINKVIITDDSKDDETKKIVANLFKKNDIANMLIYVRNSESLGACRNFFNGLTYTESEYVMFCDQDDIWLEHKIIDEFNLIKRLEDDKNIPCLVFTDSCVVDSHLNTINNSFFNYQNHNPKWTENFNNILIQNIAPGCTMLVNRSALDKLKFTDNKCILMHDWWLLLICGAFGKIGFINSATMLYRQHEHNVVGAGYTKLSDFILDFFNTMNQSKISFNKVLQQARYFLLLYKEDLVINKKNKEIEVLEIISNFNALSKINKIKYILNGTVKKDTLIRNLGLIFLIIFSK